MNTPIIIVPWQEDFSRANAAVQFTKTWAAPPQDKDLAHRGFLWELSFARYVDTIKGLGGQIYDAVSAHLTFDAARDKREFYRDVEWTDSAGCTFLTDFKSAAAPPAANRNLVVSFKDWCLKHQLDACYPLGNFDSKNQRFLCYGWATGRDVQSHDYKRDFGMILPLEKLRNIQTFLDKF